MVGFFVVCFGFYVCFFVWGLFFFVYLFVFPETNLHLVSLDIFYSATVPSAILQLGPVHFGFFWCCIAEHRLKSKKACKYTVGYVGNPIALGVETYMLRDKRILQ